MRLVSALLFVICPAYGDRGNRAGQEPYPNSRRAIRSTQQPGRAEGAPTNFERKTGRNNPALNFFGAPSRASIPPSQCGRCNRRRRSP